MSGNKDCKFCNKAGLRMLPLIYAVLSSDKPDDLTALPALPKKLGAGVTDLKLGDSSKYAVRILREGYLYVLLERSKIKYWTAYAVLEDAFLYVFDAENPPQETKPFTCERSTHGIDASMIDIPKAEDVANAWLLFTPSPMTAAKLAEYKKNAEAFTQQGKLQHFSPSGWLNGQTSQTHTLLAAEVPQNVPEYLLSGQTGEKSQGGLGKLLANQLFPACQDALGLPLEGTKKVPNVRLDALNKDMVKKGYGAIALYDHIGITQSLNNFRNDALSSVEKFLGEKKDDIGNQRRLEVSQAIEDVKAGFIKHGIGIAQKQIEMVDSANMPNFDAQNAKTLRGLGRVKEAEALEARVKEHEERKAKNRESMLRGDGAEKEWNRKYQPLLAYKEEIDPFKEKLKKISDVATEKLTHRAPDHTQWVKSERLVDAFDVYDPLSTSSGFCFTQEHMHCTFGMFGAESNTPLLASWFNVSKVERSNLYMRANLFNSKELQDEASKAFAEARQQVAAAGTITAVASAPWSKAAKGLVDGLKKVDSAWDEWLRDKVVKDIHLGKVQPAAGNPIHNLSTFHRGCEGLMYARIAEWAQALSNKKGGMDHKISAVVGMLIYGKLGDLAERIGIDEFLPKIKAEKIAQIKEQHRTQERLQKASQQAKVEAKAKAKVDAAKVEGSIDELIKDEQKKVREKVKITLDEIEKGKRPETNNFRQARMGCLLMAIEGFALTTKIEQFKGDTRALWEIGGSILSLTSMSFDIVYAVTKSIREIEPYSKMPGIEKGANLMRGGLKLTAGTLSAFAGGISVVLEFTSAREEWGKQYRNSVLVAIYTARGVTGVFGVWFGSIAAFSYGAPVFARLAKSGLAKQSAWLLRFAVGAGEAARGYDAVRTLWLIRVARVNLIGLTITAGEIGYRCFIMDDDLENWCQACIFRKDKSTGFFSEKPFPDTKTELEALEKAFRAIKE